MENSHGPNADIALRVRALGWPEPQRFVHSLADREQVVWYECGADYERGLLQINLLPCLSACAYVLRFGLCSGWVTLEGPIEALPASEAAQWLHFHNFIDARAAAEYTRLHPECSGFTWQNLRASGEPYRVQRIGGEGASSNEWVRIRSGVSDK